MGRACGSGDRRATEVGFCPQCDLRRMVFYGLERFCWIRVCLLKIDPIPMSWSPSRSARIAAPVSKLGGESRDREA